jgi:hypothetical protein
MCICLSITPDDVAAFDSFLGVGLDISSTICVCGITTGFDQSRSTAHRLHLRHPLITSFFTTKP